MKQVLRRVFGDASTATASELRGAGVVVIVTTMALAVAIAVCVIALGLKDSVSVPLVLLALGVVAGFGVYRFLWLAQPPNALRVLVSMAATMGVVFFTAAVSGIVAGVAIVTTNQAPAVAIHACQPSTDKPIAPEAFHLDEQLPLFIYARGRGPQAADVATFAVTSITAALATQRAALVAAAPAGDPKEHPTARVLSNAIRATSALIHARYTDGTAADVDILFVHDQVLIGAHVGAARFSLIRNDVVSDLNDEHTVRREVALGTLTPLAGTAIDNTPTRVVGRDADVEVDLVSVDLVRRDRVVFFGHDDQRHFDAPADGSPHDFVMSTANGIISARSLTKHATAMMLEFQPSYPAPARAFEHCSLMTVPR